MSRKKKRSGRQRRADKAQIKSLAASGALRCHVEALEARLLLSAEPLLGITSQDKPLDAEGWVQAVEQSLVQQSFPDLASAASAAESDGLNAASPSVVLFIDATVAGAVELAESVPGGARVVLLDAGADGIAKITAELSQSQDLDSIQIISHGASGMLQLGGTTLAAATLDAYADDLAAWGRALSDDGDLLFFGCNVAAGQRGQDFLSQVALYTSADVAASVNLSGSAALGGDWNLEASVGQVDATSAIAADVVDAAELLLITVNLGSTVVHPTEGFGYGSTIDGFGQAVVPNSRWPASGNIPPSASFQLAETKAFTQEFWFFPRPKLNAEEIYAEEIYWWTADQIRQINAVGVVDGGTGLQFNTMVGTATLTNVLNPDAWNHISQTYDGTRFTIFINGVEEFTTDDFAGRTPAEPDSIRMRGNPGAIDELRVWNTARSQAEIQKSMLETLTGTESGLVGYWQFEEDAAVSSDMLDRTGRGSHLQSVNFEVFNDPAPQIGYVDVMLSQEVDNGIGLFVAYQISAGSTADEDVDFLSSRFRTDSEDKDSETLGIIIPNQEIAGRIYFMARPDAIFEPTETIKISLSEPPFTFSNSTYDVGLQKTQTINIIDNGAYTPGFAVTDAFGRSVTPEVDGQTSQPLYYDQTSKFADLDIKLTSQPVGTVDLLITAGSNTYFAANTGETVTLTFTPTDWDVPQRQRLSLLSPATEAVFTIRRFGGTAPEYLPAGIKQFKFTKETSEGQVEEGCPTVPLVPALSIVAARDATEGDGAGALFEILLDAPAPPTGLIVPLLNGGQATAGEDFEPLPLGFFIEPGAQRAELPITIINDWIDEETETLTIELVETNEYKVVDANRIATVQITDDDLARIAVSNFTPLTPPSLAAEPSDTFDTAIDVGRVRPGQLLTGGKFDQAGDVDLLRFTLDRSFANLDTATLTFYEPNGDIGYRLYDAAETLIDSQFISSSQTKREVTLSLLKPSGEYFLEVFGVASSYDIKFVGSDVEPNNDFASAIDLGRVEPGIAFAGSLASPGDVDIYRFTIDESIARFDGVTLNFSHQVGDLALELYNANQTSIGFENSSSNRESIGFPL